MTVALLDNGSLEPAAHRNLRAVATALSAQTGVDVRAVSWKHSGRIRAEQLDGVRALTIAPWLRAQVGRGEREFVFVPFFVSAQGAIGSALRSDIETLQRELAPFTFTFTEGLAAQGAIAGIVSERVRETIRARALTTPPVIVVDHGGPSFASAALRNALAAEVRRELGATIGPLAAASMEGTEHAHNQPLLADLLATAPFNSGDVVIAPLFLSPGRHAGPQGDLAQIARAAEDRVHGAACPAPAGGLHAHFTDLVGTHPRAVDALATALRATLSTLPAETLA
jgi:sirohydrochlorin ferrochelatase